MSVSEKRLIIIGAGAFGRELRDIAEGIKLLEGERCPWEFAGFLDDREGILDGKNAAAATILGAPSDYQPWGNDLFICAIGDPKVRRKYAGMLRAKRGKFATLVEPSSRVGRGAKLAEGVLIGPFCAISCDLSIGADTMILAHATIGHDVTVGAGCHIGAHAFIGGGAMLGDAVTVHPHAVILPGKRIGDGCVVGAASLVVSDFRDGETAFGIPARRVAS
jgi:sugar O-acyltransferase (sialic acid O-acetyltransferase NeuD family)